LPTRIVGVELTPEALASSSKAVALADTCEDFASVSIRGTRRPGMLAAAATTMFSSSQPVFSVPWFR